MCWETDATQVVCGGSAGSPHWTGERGGQEKGRKERWAASTLLTLKGDLGRRGDLRKGGVDR